VLFTNQSQLTSRLHAARAIGNQDRKLQQLARIDLLIIDDFGLKPLRAAHDEDLHELIAERYERTSTLVTSNLDIDEWSDVFPGNRVLGQATIDRLRHGAYRLVLDGASYRTPRPDESGAKPTLAKNAGNTASWHPVRGPNQHPAGGSITAIMGGSNRAVGYSRLRSQLWAAKRSGTSERR